MRLPYIDSLKTITTLKVAFSPATVEILMMNHSDPLDRYVKTISMQVEPNKVTKPKNHWYLRLRHQSSRR